MSERSRSHRRDIKHWHCLHSPPISDTPLTWQSAYDLAMRLSTKHTPMGVKGERRNIQKLKRTSDVATSGRQTQWQELPPFSNRVSTRGAVGTAQQVEVVSATPPYIHISPLRAVSCMSRSCTSARRASLQSTFF